MKTELLERVSACALNRIFGYEPLIARKLVDSLGSAGAVFTASREDLRTLLGPYSKYNERIRGSILDECADELERLAGKGCRFIPYDDPDYPALLKECPDAPAGLYFKSESSPAEVFGSKKTISVVGTRNQSLYGKEWCERTVLGMSRNPEVCIVSGLAIGVDITAHMAALAAGLSTIAVLPTGITEIYPQRHSVAADKIARSPGSALVTDFPPGTGPQACTFLRRNRIIAALGSATILIESGIKGGGMLTARLASGYGRDVFCLPGRIDDEFSRGCNLLIRENVAQTISDLDVLALDLGLRGAVSGKRNEREALLEAYSPDCSEEKVADILKIYEIIRRNRGASIEELAGITGMPYSRAAGLTGLLESDGFICTDLLQRCTINVKKL